MADTGENLEAYISFKADSAGLDSTIDKAVGSINRIGPTAGKAEGAIKKVWATKSGAAALNTEIRHTGDELDNVGKKAKHAEGGLENFFKSLKKSGGRRSALGETVELFRGGAAVMAVSMIGEALAKGAENANELDKALRDGEMDAAGFAVALGKSLPIFGGFVTAGQSIRAMIERHTTGSSDQDAVDETKEDTALLNKQNALRSETIKATKESGIGYKDKAEDTTGKLRLANTITERDKRKVEVDIEYRTNSRGLNETLDKEIEHRKEALTAEIDAINETYKGRLADSSAMSDTERLTYTQDALDEIDKAAHQAKEAKTAKLSSAVAIAANDIKSLETAAKGAQAALDKLHTKAVEDVTGIAKELRELQHETEIVGKSDLDKYTLGLQHSGLTDPKLIDELAVQKAKQIGAIWHESLMLPMEKYEKENGNLKQLLDKGGINNQDFMRAQYKNAHEVLSSVKTNSVEGAFMENLKSRFVEQGINSQVDDINAQKKANFAGFKEKNDPNRGEYDPYFEDTSWDYFGGGGAGGAGGAGAATDQGKSRVNPWGYMQRGFDRNQKIGSQTKLDMSDPEGWGKPKQSVDENTKALDGATDQTKTLNDNLAKLNTTLATGIVGMFA